MSGKEFVSMYNNPHRKIYHGLSVVGLVWKVCVYWCVCLESRELWGAVNKVGARWKLVHVTTLILCIMYLQRNAPKTPNPRENE
ncbi:hypothetical protein BDZ45DRAFT_326263 [Acephala macrosclerotiorum]|nr:hypothetical protein BDZ45DRAFT_326263 [Acephala macrosclerotiorum]